MDIIRAVIRKIWLVILLGIVCAALLFAYAKVSSSELYTASLKMMVVTEEEYDDINAVYQKWRPTTVDYGNIIMSTPVLAEVIDELDLDMTPEELADKITIILDERSTILQITVTDKSGDAALAILNSYKNAFMKYIEEDVKVSLPVILEVSDRALAAGQGFGASKMAALGFIAGILLALAVIVFLEIYNEKIRDIKEAEECLKVRTLADYSADPGAQADMLKGQVKIFGEMERPLLFTSCVPAAVKHKIVGELGEKLASNGLKVNVIDLDRSDPISVPDKESVPGLTYVTPEKGANDMTEAELKEMISGAESASDIVLVNAPAMGSSIDAAVLGKYCDRAVLIIKKGAVKAADALKMKEQLEECGCALAGTVLVK